MFLITTDYICIISMISQCCPFLLHESGFSSFVIKPIRLSTKCSKIIAKPDPFSKIKPGCFEIKAAVGIEKYVSIVIIHNYFWFEKVNIALFMRLIAYFIAIHNCIFYTSAPFGACFIV